MSRLIPAALLLAACPKPASPPAADEGPVTLTILAMNDFHGALHEQADSRAAADAPDRWRGGLQWLAGAVDAVRAEDPDLILLDGGDIFQGQWAVNATEGRGAVEALNLLRVDAAAIGNHEFDYGPLEGGDPENLRGALEEGARAATFRWLAANVYEEDGARWTSDNIQPWTVIERKGKRVGVVGLVTTDTPQTTLLANVADLSFKSGVETVRELLPELEAADLDALVLVGHLTGACEPPGYFEPVSSCTPSGEIGALLTELPPGTFDVMVLGHAHTLLAHRDGDTFLMEQRDRGHALGRVDLVIGPDGVDMDASRIHPPIPIAHPATDPGCGGGEWDRAPRALGPLTVSPSEEAIALIERLEAEAGSLCEELGCNAQALWRSRTEEAPAGNFMADAMLGAFPGADLAVQNSGGVRADLPAGPVRREDLQAMMPFDNRVMLVELSGADVLRMFRLGSSGAHGILQVAGATYGFDPARTGGTDLDGDGAVADWETDRLCEARVGGAPIDPERTYKVVTTDFLYGGGDHMGLAFGGKPVLAEGDLLREVLYESVRAREGVCLGQDEPLYDPAAKRVTVGPCD